MTREHRSPLATGFQRQVPWGLRRPIVATATISVLVLVAVSMVGAQLR